MDIAGVSGGRAVPTRGPSVGAVGHLVGYRAIRAAPAAGVEARRPSRERTADLIGAFSVASPDLRIRRRP